MSDPAEFRDLALSIAREVVPELRRRAGGVDVSATKSTVTDLVTEVDCWAEERIVARILDARPDDAVLAEEGAGVAGTSGVRWLVDPIDGTTNFVYGHPGFSVSIGVEVDNRPVAGVVVDPLLGDEFCAAHGQGATRNGRPVRVSSVSDPAAALVATGFAYDSERRRLQAEALVTILPRVRDVRRVGGAALDLASVSCGRVDAYFEWGLSPWDCSAGSVLVTEAGGVITLFKTSTSAPPFPVAVTGEEASMNWSDDLVVMATNRDLATPLTELLLEAGALSGP
ncbi:MAG: inositol monophosphatase [Acidimicrobiales bacterium]|nr:inositol monophosphatase [Acidimicrobiales bacterium]